MSEQWMYQAFGQDFGPISFSELQELAATGVVSADSEVRAVDDFSWQRAECVAGLNFVGSGGGTLTQTSKKSGSDSDIATKGVDEWYCRVGGLELGPLTFDELLDLAKTEQLAVDDDVKLGASGKWRRAGSIGRLMAALPYQHAQPKKVSASEAGQVASSGNRRTSAQNDRLVSAARVIPAAEPPVVKTRPAVETPAAVDSQVAFQVAFRQAKEAIAAQILAQAEAVYKAAEESARSEVAWASAPNVDKQWWGWMGSAEFGPVEFAQVFALAKNGQLKPTDFIRNGAFGQFVPSSSLPGLYSAVAKMAKAAEALELAKSQARAAIESADPAPAPAARALATPAAAPVAATVAPSPRRQPAISPRETAVATVESRSIPSEPPVNSQVIPSTMNRVSPSSPAFQPRSTPMEPIAARTNFEPAIDRPAVVQAVRPAALSEPISPYRRPVAKMAPSRSAGPGMFDNLKEMVTQTYRNHLIALGVATVLFAWWFYPRSPVRPVAVHPVKGRVVIDGEPLANAAIVLHQVGKKNKKLPGNLYPHAKAAADGTFALETFANADGAPEGDFVATVFLMEETTDPDGERTFGPNLLPAQYCKVETSPFKVKITSATKELEPLRLTRQ